MLGAVGEVGAIGRVPILVVGQLELGGKRQPAVVVHAADRGTAQLGAIERVVRGYRLQQFLQARQLLPRQLLAGAARLAVDGVNWK